MPEDIFSKIIDEIKDGFLDKKKFKTDADNFKNLIPAKQESRIAFVDGGQAELLRAADFSLQFIRTAGIVFNGNVKEKQIINEFFVLIKTDGDYYKTEIFLVKGNSADKVIFNSLDRSIMNGNEKAEISKIAGVMRRFAEIKLAKEIINDADIIVLDGSLKSMVTGESEQMNLLFDKAADADVVLCGLAKTSRILEDGICVLSKLEKEGEWHYYIKNEQGYAVYGTKLNKNSKHVFQFDILQKEKADFALGCLMKNSNDAVFPGYPYGLILADKIARVSNEERDYLLTKIKAKFGENWKTIEKSLNVLNGHSVLDKIG